MRLPVLLLALILSATCLAHENTDSNLPLIEVSTSASAKALPDQAELNITFSSTKLEAEKARKLVDKRVESFLDTLKRYELEENSLDSSQTQVNPKYDYKNGQRQLTGYQVNRELSFKLNDLAQLQNLIELVTVNKASRLGRLDFTLKKPERLKRKALKKAISKAKNKAAIIANNFGVKLGSIYRVSHSDGEHRSAPKMRMMAMKADMSEAESNTYQQKEIEVHASINAAFTID